MNEGTRIRNDLSLSTPALVCDLRGASIYAAYALSRAGVVHKPPHWGVRGNRLGRG